MLFARRYFSPEMSVIFLKCSQIINSEKNTKVCSVSLDYANRKLESFYPYLAVRELFFPFFRAPYAETQKAEAARVRISADDDGLDAGGWREGAVTSLVELHRLHDLVDRHRELETLSVEHRRVSAKNLHRRAAVLPPRTRNILR